MILIQQIDKNDDFRRCLTAFRPPADFPKSAESKVIITKKDGVQLGNHSHPHNEGFMLVSGSCSVRTWTEKSGVQELELTAPIMFMFEQDEEHLLTCSNEMVLIGYMPITFMEENNTRATHL